MVKEKEVKQEVEVQNSSLSRKLYSKDHVNHENMHSIEIYQYLCGHSGSLTMRITIVK